MYRQWKDKQEQFLHLRRSSWQVRTQATPSRLNSGDTITVDLSVAKASEIPPGMIQELPEGGIIGQGRFGVCRKVLMQGTPVCAKTFLTSDSHTKSLLLYEASMLFKVRHPHIACIFGVQTEQEPFQLIMVNYSVDGINLSVYDTLDAAKLTSDKAGIFDLIHPSLTLEAWLVIMKDLALALAFIHSKSIIDRDLKSDNIVLNKQGDIIFSAF